MIRRIIRKFSDGGLDNTRNPSIPKTSAEVYVRNRYGQTFHVHSLAEGILHLISNEGYRLSFWEYSEASANDSFPLPSAITVYRDGNELSVRVQSAHLDNLAYTPNELKFQLDNIGGYASLMPVSSDCELHEITIDGS